MAGKVGRPLIEFDLAQVETFASRGLTHEQIADALGISAASIYNHKKRNLEFFEAIKRGRAKGIATMTNALFQQAKNGNAASAIFWLKNQAGWRDKLELTGEDGGPMRHVISADPISLDQWEKQQAEKE